MEIFNLTVTNFGLTLDESAPVLRFGKHGLKLEPSPVMEPSESSGFPGRRSGEEERRSGRRSGREMGSPLMAAAPEALVLERSGRQERRARAESSSSIPLDRGAGSSSGAPPPLHRNIRFSIAFTFLLYAARGLWQSTVLALYIVQLSGGAKAPIGFVQGAQGIATLAVAGPAGWACDRFGRARVLQAAGVCGLLAVGCTLLAVWLESVLTLGVALGLWGIFSGAHTPALGALIADSAAGGPLARLYVLRQIALQLATAIGPAVVLCVFVVRGNSPGGSDPGQTGGSGGSGEATDGWDETLCAALVVAGAVAQVNN
ncbi:hypothetical protein T492DRAFT_1152468 [Pavlovales sp. CCMP2436]|nr:hypothetical protein T492DRAFT_1152468 [Pavlovales sp. CCMP2436]